jgi:HEAT repeat protein
VEHGDRDFAAIYRRGIAEHAGRDKTVALEGLGEVGGAEDADIFLEFLRDPNARVRAAAIAGIGRCDGNRHLDDLEAALRDPSSTVRRAATPFAKLYLGRDPVQRVRRELRERPARAPDRHT